MNTAALNTNMKSNCFHATRQANSHFDIACDYLIKQTRKIGRQAILSRCANHLVDSGVSNDDASVVAVQAYAYLSTFNSRNSIDIDASTSSVVMLNVNGIAEPLALTADDIVALWRAKQ